MSSIRKRQRKHGVRYEVVVDLGPHPETGKRRQRTRTLKSLREAKIVEAKWVTEINAGTAVDRSTQTIRDLLTTWMDAEVAHLKPQTVRSYEYIINRYLLPGLGHVQVQKLTPLHLQEFYARSRTEGFSPWTISYGHQRLHQALAMAVRLGLVQYNATSAVTVPPAPRREMRTWAPDEAAVYIERSRSNGLWPLWEVALTTGLRKGELLALRWGDIDFEDSSLRVRQTYSRTGVTTPKTRNSARLVPLLPEPLESLREHRRRQNEARLALGPVWINNDLVFCADIGNYYSDSRINTEHAKIIRQCGVTRIRFHDIRHTYATFALARGIPVHVVSAILGHARASITSDVYAHVLPHQYQEVRETLTRLFYEPDDSGQREAPLL